MKKLALLTILIIFTVSFIGRDFAIAQSNNNLNHKRLLWKKATRNYQEKKYEKAIKHWEQILEIDPEHSESKRMIKKAKKILQGDGMVSNVGRYAPLKRIPRPVSTSLSDNDEELLYSLSVGDKKISILPSEEFNKNEVSLADALTTAFMETHFKIIERSQIFRILEEHRLSFTGILEKENLDLIGKVANIDAIVICSKSLFPVRNMYGTIIGQNANVNLRMVDIKTGSIIMTVSGMQPYNWSDSFIASDMAGSIEEAIEDQAVLSGDLPENIYNYLKRKREWTYREYYKITGRGKPSEEEIRAKKQKEAEENVLAVLGAIVLAAFTYYAVVNWMYPPVEYKGGDHSKRKNKYLKLLRFKF